MARRKSTEVAGYWRGEHYTQPHKRMLNDGMMLELAEGQNSSDIWHTDWGYYIVPDPRNLNPPIYVREDVAFYMNDAEYSKFIDYITSFNDSRALNILMERRAAVTSGSLNEGEESSVDWGEVVSIVDTVVSWFDSGSSGDENSPSNPVQNFSFIGADGLVACTYPNNQGGLILMGLNPIKKQLIAFSKPEEALKIFTQLPLHIPPQQWVKLPSQVPQSLIDKALSNPNKIIQYIAPTTAGGTPTTTVETVTVTGVDPTTGQPTIETSSTESSSQLVKLAMWGVGIFAASKIGG